MPTFKLLSEFLKWIIEKLYISSKYILLLISHTLFRGITNTKLIIRIEMFSLFVRSSLCISTKSNFKQVRRFTDASTIRRPRFNRHTRPLRFDQPNEEPNKPVEEEIVEVVKPYFSKELVSKELEIPKKEYGEFTAFVEVISTHFKSSENISERLFRKC